MTTEEYIKLHLQPDSEPALTADELALVIAMANVTDSEGHLPTDPDWVPTYEPNNAIAQGWRIKASKAASNYNFKDNGLELDRKQVYDNCIKQAEYWQEQAVSTTSNSGSDGDGGLSLSTTPSWLKSYIEGRV